MEKHFFAPMIAALECVKLHWKVHNEISKCMFENPFKLHCVFSKAISYIPI